MNKKNRKGELGLGTIIMLFIGIIVALTLLVPIFDTQAQMTETVDSRNVTYTAPAANGTIDLGTAQELITLIGVTNHSSGAAIPTWNYNIAEGISATTNKKVVQYTSATNATYVGDQVNISMVYGAEGYNTDSGSRSVGRMIGLFSALALLTFVLLGVKNEWFS